MCAWLQTNKTSFKIAVRSGLLTQVFDFMVVKKDVMVIMSFIAQTTKNNRKNIDKILSKNFSILNNNKVFKLVSFKVLKFNNVKVFLVLTFKVINFKSKKVF